MSSDHLVTSEQAVTEFAVVRYIDGWRILAGARRWGRFTYRVDAEEAALRLADNARTGGRDARVLVQGSDGQLRRLDVA